MATSDARRVVLLVGEAEWCVFERVCTGPLVLTHEFATEPFP